MKGEREEEKEEGREKGKQKGATSKTEQQDRVMDAMSTGTAEPQSPYLLATNPIQMRYSCC